MLGLLRMVILLTILGMIAGASTAWQLVLLPVGIVLFVGRYVLLLPGLRWGRLVRSQISPTWVSDPSSFGDLRERAVLSLRRPPSIPLLLLSAAIVAAIVPFSLAQLGGVCIGDDPIVVSSTRVSSSLSQRFPDALAAIFRLLSFVLIEEFVFRGWLLFALRKFLGAPIAVMVTSYLFAVGHLRPDAGISLLFGGLAFGTATVLTGSIWAGVALHLTYNTSLWAWDRFGDIFGSGAVGCSTSAPFFVALAAALFSVLWIGRRRRGTARQRKSVNGV